MQLGDHLGFAGLILALIGIGVAFLWPEKRWIGYLALIAAAILFISWGILASRKGEPSSSARNIERSFLSAGLVIDKVTKDGVNLHLLLTGNGPNEVVLLKSIVHTESRLDFDAGVVTPRSIPPNTSLSLNGLFFKADLEDPITSILVYSTKIEGVEKTFTVKYRFSVRPIDLRPKVLNAFSRQESEGDSVDSNLGKDALMGAVRLPTGALTFWFSDTKPFLIAAGPTRALYFDPQSRTVHLAMTSGGQAFSLQRPLLKPKDGMHFVAASWDNSKHVHLYVDGSR
jgi:hypothetical protein